jgi:hypothetical protein
MTVKELGQAVLDKESDETLLTINRNEKLFENILLEAVRN